VNGSDAELALDGGNERWALEQSSGESLESARKLRLASRQLVVQTDDANVFLSGSLLGLYKTGGAVDADNETSGNFRVEGTTVASLLNSSHLSAKCTWDYSRICSYLSMRLIHDTTSCEDGLEGLSRLITPELMYDFRSRDSGAHPLGMGVKWEVRTSTICALVEYSEAIW
jgi:hypothetical protein